MIPVQFPNHAFNIKHSDNSDFIFDLIRKQWLLLTPEEWVRQNFIQYLLQCLHYPQSLIAVEKEIVTGELRKRFDIVVYDQLTQPWMLIECKAMNIALHNNIIDQALRYNQKLKAVYLVITNGTFTRCFQLQPQVQELTTMPAWQTN